MLHGVCVHTKRAPLKHPNVTAKAEHISTQVEPFSSSLCANHQITQDLLPVTTDEGLLDILQLSQDTRILCLRWWQPPQPCCATMMILTTEGWCWTSIDTIQEYNRVSNIRGGVSTNDSQVLTRLDKGQSYRKSEGVSPQDCNAATKSIRKYTWALLCSSALQCKVSPLPQSQKYQISTETIQAHS